MPHLVRENLFIGNITDAAEVLDGTSSSDITHLLSVLSSASISFFSEWRPTLSIPTKEISKVYFNRQRDGPAPDDDDHSAAKLMYSLEYAGNDFKLVRMAVPIRDTESEDLLDYLEVCLDFIDRSRKEGSVLVHCFAGVSRSAAIITAYLMRSEQLSLEDALKSLRESCEFVCPNDGFLDQLKMYEDMGFKVDHGSSVYKRFHVKILGMHSLLLSLGSIHISDCFNRGDKIDSAQFAADPGVAAEVTPQTGTPPNGERKRVQAYRCKKCRRLVALQENVVGHVPGEGETSFSWNKRKSGNPFSKSDGADCSSIFIEPLRWMTAVEEGGLEGKLACAHCDARLGYFNWAGIQCSCGSWITPAFQLHKGRVDVSTV
ncbi:Dual specificity protein phosphatase 12 [Linum grandiflorum]